MRRDFPITPLLPEILEALAATPRLVLEAPPGAGKTTQLPLALLQAPWLAGQRILLLEPRRIAARAAAEFMAAQLGEAVGATVGYRIRFESKIGPATRIEVLTEGILTRLLQDDPELAGVGAILFDEFHERHLAADLAAALAREVQASLRPQLRLVVMSATLDGERMACWLEAPRISSPGRSFPVRIDYPPARSQERGERHLARVALQALAAHEGDVLAFLPGRREIAAAKAVLDTMLEGRVEVLILHGELSLGEQRAALAAAAAGQRRIVLATNVAESSLTLPGIRTVIDAGWAREPRFDPTSGFTRLQMVRISQASADQRAGRAGRLAAGTAYRLWPESQRLERSRAPEIAQVELSALALELAAWGAAEADRLLWLDPPPAGALAQARELLQQLGALTETGRITALGRQMLKLGAPPRLAAAALRAPPALRDLMADLLALLEAPSPLRGEAAHSDDFRARARALHRWRDRRSAAGRDGLGADGGALAAIEQTAKGWRRRLDGAGAVSGWPDSHCVGDLLLAAFPDRIAYRDPQQPLRYTLANGRGARLREDSALLGEPWLLVLDLRLEAGDSLIFTAAPFDPQRLEQDYPERFQAARVVQWNAAKAALEAWEESRFAAIVLKRQPLPLTAEETRTAWPQTIRARGLDSLPWSEPSRRLRARIEALRGWMPELGLPAMSDAALLAGLETWLGPYLMGKRSLDGLGEDGLLRALEALLDHPQRSQLARHAPERLGVPSGQARLLEYPPAAAPVLAVKLQELFGLADTPRIAEGRVAVTLQLLSPAGRPIQVTQDLRGFWERIYPEAKKELKSRYPRHPWPDDPWTAAPTHRAKPRGR